ncbi:MAG: hypothetical protein V1837_07400 [Candidatus Woesearchaeota archaeon]
MAKVNDNPGQVLARLIVEMIGTPKDHLEHTLTDFIKMLKDDSELKVVAEDYAEPVEKGKMFSTFVELEIWFKNVPRLLNFCFEAMPSSVEILEPVSLGLNAGEFSGYLNDLQARLHTVDMAIKELEAKKMILERNAEALLKNLITLSVKDSPKELSVLSDDVGINTEDLKPLVDHLVDKGYLKNSDGVYSRA